MAIRIYYSMLGTCMSYYRFTCEKCGCKTHWIPGEVSAETPGRSESKLEQAMEERIRELKEALEACVAGKRMLIDAKPVGIFAFSGKCPKCNYEQSWAPRLAPGFFTRKQKKNADAFNATPVLSEPDVVFGGGLPEEDEHDFKVPCTLVIKGTSFGVPHESPIYLNGDIVGYTEKNSIDLTVETFYRDNRITVMLPLWTSYVEAEEGKTIQLEYRNFLVRKV